MGQNNGRIFQLADAVEVELNGVSLRHRSLDLKIAGMPEPQARERREERADRRERPHRR